MSIYQRLLLPIVSMALLTQCNADQNGKSPFHTTEKGANGESASDSRVSISDPKTIESSADGEPAPEEPAVLPVNISGALLVCSRPVFTDGNGKGSATFHCQSPEGGEEESWSLTSPSQQGVTARNAPSGVEGEVVFTIEGRRDLVRQFLSTASLSFKFQRDGQSFGIKNSFLQTLSADDRLEFESALAQEGPQVDEGMPSPAPTESQSTPEEALPVTTTPNSEPEPPQPSSMDATMSTPSAPTSTEPRRLAPNMVEAQKLVLWLDSSDQTTLSADSCSSSVRVPMTGEGIRCWHDKSGNGFRVDDGNSSGKSPSYQGGAKPGVFLANSYLNGTLRGRMANNSSHTIFVVARLGSTVSKVTPVRIGRLEPSRSTAMIFQNNRLRYEFFEDRTQYEPNTLQETSIYTVVYNGIDSALSNKKAYVNGSELTGEKIGSTDSPIDIPNNPYILIGWTAKNAEITIHEIIIYDENLGDSDRRAVEAYLLNKWKD